MQKPNAKGKMGHCAFQTEVIMVTGSTAGFRIDHLYHHVFDRRICSPLRLLMAKCRILWIIFGFSCREKKSRCWDDWVHGVQFAHFPDSQRKWLKETRKAHNAPEAKAERVCEGKLERIWVKPSLKMDVIAWQNTDFEAQHRSKTSSCLERRGYCSPVPWNFNRWVPKKRTWASKL